MKLRDMRLGSFFVALAAMAAFACGSDSKSGGDGSTGGTGGSGGSGGSSGADASGTVQNFQVVKPCPTKDDYKSGSEVKVTTSLTYDPKCLKVAKGTAVKFTGDTTMHPLTPSKNRGDETGSPIKETKTGMDPSFTFDKAGFFGYYCGFHGTDATGDGMAGVVWVTP